MTNDITIWAAWIVGFVMVVTLVGFAWHALFADKARDRRRCPRCWHILNGLTSLRCPECGHEARSERQLHRTHRHYGLAALWISLLVGGAIYLRLAAMQQGFVTFVPTGTLVWMATHGIEAGAVSDVRNELMDRIMRGGLDDATLNGLVEAILAGDSDAPPCSPEWQTRYGVLAQLLIQVDSNLGALDDDPLHAATARLASLPPYVQLNAALPEPGAPINVEMMLTEWWPPSTQARVRIRDAVGGSEETFGLDPALPTRPLSFQLAAGDIAGRVVEVGVQTRLLDSDGKPIGGWSAERVSTVPVTIDKFEPTLQPVKSDAIDRAVQSVFAPGIMRWEKGSRPVAFSFNWIQTGSDDCDGVTFGVIVELLEGNTVRRTLHAWWSGGPRRGGFRAEVIYEDLPALQRVPDDGKGWSMRVRGDERIARRAVVAPPAPDDADVNASTRFWSGECTFPASVQPRTGEAPRRRWYKPPPD